MLGLAVWPLDRAAPADLAEVAQVIVDINVRNAGSVGALKELLARFPAELPRRFIVENGADTHLSRVQANALGATHHVSRQRAEAELRRSLSSVAELTIPIPSEKQAAIAAAPGGRSVLAAGGAIATLFDSLVGERRLDATPITAASAAVLDDVADIGGKRWLETVRVHHESTFQHCLLVTGVAATYAAGSGLGRPAATALVNAAMLHDIGKATVPLSILDKPGKLTEGEFAVVRRHPRAGYDYLRANASLPEPILDAVLHHHEALDGSGYPDGLSGTAVKPLARVLAVCDVFAAMVERRAYKAPETPSSAILHLVDMALRSRVDYDVVRRLAGAFDISLPPTLDTLERQPVSV